MKVVPIPRRPHDHATAIRWVHCGLFIATLVTLSDARGDGGVVLVRKSIGNETYVLLGNESALKVGLVDLDLVVEGRELRSEPLEVTFSHADGRGRELTIVAKPQSLGKAVLFRLHLELRKAGPWTVTIPVSTGKYADFEVNIREGASVPWQMAAWYLWPFVVVFIYAVREVNVRSRSQHAHRLRTVEN